MQEKAKPLHPESPRTVTCQGIDDIVETSSLWHLRDAAKRIFPQTEKSSLSCFCVNADEINLSKEESDLLHSFLLNHELSKVLRLRQESDRKIALLSILLQRKIIRDQLECCNADFEIQRTAKSKPYVVSTIREVGEWNYNVSHHGSYVGIVSHDSDTVGTDIVHVKVRKGWKLSAQEYVDIFHAQFTPLELLSMKQNPSDSDIYTHFFVNWSLKEAYVKGIGEGLQIDLQRIHFDIFFNNQKGINKGGTACLKLDGRVANDWRFSFRWLDDTHVMSVAQKPKNSTELPPTFPPSNSTRPRINTNCGDKSKLDDELFTCPKTLKVEDLLCPFQHQKWEALFHN